MFDVESGCLLEGTARSKRELLVLLDRDCGRLLDNENDNGSRAWNSANNEFSDIQRSVTNIPVTILE